MLCFLHRNRSASVILGETSIILVASTNQFFPVNPKSIIVCDVRVSMSRSPTYAGQLDSACVFFSVSGGGAEGVSGLPSICSPGFQWLSLVTNILFNCTQDDEECSAAACAAVECAAANNPNDKIEGQTNKHERRLTSWDGMLRGRIQLQLDCYITTLFRRYLYALLKGSSSETPSSCIHTLIRRW
jgi:hypothetical protein